MLKVRNLSLHLGGLQILNNLTFDVKEGKVTGLIGPNGAGKSSFYNALFGFFPPNTGSIRWKEIELIGKNAHEINLLGIARTFQDTRLLPQITVLENMMVSARFSAPTTLGRVFFHPLSLKEERKAHEKRALALLKKVGLEGRAHSLAKNLSYGQSKLIEILKLFMGQSELILLDEPFSGLFPEMIKVVTALIRELIASGKAIVFVEHNMKLIAEICDHVIVLDAGAKIAEGTFNQIKKNPTVIEAYLGD